MKKRLIGIIGGMGPLAGVELQRLIISLTPAVRDQDHLRVICLTEPKIPDRTASLLKDDGESYVRVLRHIAKELEKAGADLIAIPCNTAHARFNDIQAVTSVPIVNMVALACRAAADRYGTSAQIGLLATAGTISTKTYESTAKKNSFPLRWIRPNRTETETVMKIVYRIKAGEPAAVSELCEIIARLRARGARGVILGCTELSLCFDDLAAYECEVIDPLRLLATYLVSIAVSKKGQCPKPGFGVAKAVTIAGTLNQKGL